MTAQRSLFKKIKKSRYVTRFRRYLVYLVSLFSCALVRSLSWRTIVRIGRRLGRFAFRVLRVERKRTLSNLQLAFAGEKTGKELLKIGEKAYENFGITALEFPKMSSLSDEEFWQTCAYDRGQIDFLWSLLEKGKGVIFASAHMSNWEMLAEFGARLGFDMSILYKPSTNPYLNRIWFGLRGHNRLIDITKDLSSVVRRLKNNEAICLLFDENARQSGINLDFFGRAASTYKGPAYFSLRTGCPIVCLYFVRQEDGRHRFIIERTIWPERHGNLEEDIVRIMKEMNLSLEIMLRKYPEQWYWFYKRWRNV